MPDIASLIANYGLLVVFLNVFAEGAGLPLPSYPAVMLAAALAPQAHYRWPEILITGVMAMMCADFGWLWAGRRFGTHVVKTLCRISLTPDSCVRATGEMFEKVGPAILLFANFVPGFSTLSIVLAGTTRVPVLLFALFDFIGVTIYLGVAVFLGTMFHSAITQILATLTRIGEWGVALVLGLLALFLLGKWAQRQALIRELRMARITTGELRRMIDSGAQPIILDVRPHHLRASEGLIPGSIHAPLTDFENAAKNLSPENEIVIYCSCPNEVSAAKAALQLRKKGFRKIRPLLGGIDAWIEAGHALEFMKQET